MSDELLGDDFRLFWDSDGDYDAPNWAEQVSLGDLGFDTGNKQVEIPIRIAFVVYKKGRADWSLTFTSNYSRNAEFHVAVRNAINNGTPIHLAIADGDDIDESNYWHAWFFLTGPIGAELDKAASIDVEGKIHHDRGENDDELPEFVAAET